MDTSTSLTEILSALQTLIANTPALDASRSRSHPVLPSSIIPLPESSHKLLSSPSQSSLTTITAHLQTHILPFLNLSSLSPRYYGFVTGGATPAALLADFIASIYDQNVAVHLPADTIATSVEVAALNLLVQLFQLPVEDWGVGSAGYGGGSLTTGATASNVLGLALGREYVLSKAVERQTGRKGVSCGEEGMLQMMHASKLQRIQVLSTMPHSSVAKAASVVGIGRASVVSVKKEGNGDSLEIDLDALRREAGQVGVASILVVSAGEVNTGRFATGSVEMMRKIREICDEFDVWMHVDGAFGLFGRLLIGDEDEGEYKAIVNGVRGIELADSITGDGHKLLNVPYDCGFFFTRHKALSEAVFQNGNAAYLTSGTAEGHGDGIQSPLNIGIENSRRFRALPVYATLLAYGRYGYIDMLKRQISLARRVTVWLLKNSKFEVLPRSLTADEILARTYMVVLFRTSDVALNRELVKRINFTGRMYVTGTSWDGQPAARLAISNWKVEVGEDGSLIEETLTKVVAESP